MATLLADTFTRADNASAVGSPTTGGPYTVRVGTWGIIGNALYTSVSTGESVLTYPSAAACDITATIVAAGVNAGIIHGWASANDYWLLQVSGGNSAQLHRKEGGSFGQRSMSVPVTLPCVLRLVVINPLIFMWVAGKLITVIDEAEPAGIPAVSGFRSSSSTANRFDDVTAVDATAYASSINGGLYSVPLLGGDPVDLGAHVLKGRDRKTLDDATAA